MYIYTYISSFIYGNIWNGFSLGLPRYKAWPGNPRTASAVAALFFYERPGPTATGPRT